MICLDCASILPCDALDLERGTRGCADIFSELAVTKKRRQVITLAGIAPRLHAASMRRDTWNPKRSECMS